MTNLVYSLPQLNFVGGSYQKFHWNFKTPTGEDDTDSRCEVTFSIVRYENKNGLAVITKPAALHSDDGEFGYDIYAELLPGETLHLHGRFVYQITICDEAGVVEIPGQGIMDIRRNINTDTVDIDDDLIVSLSLSGNLTVSGNSDDITGGTDGDDASLNGDGIHVDYTDGVMTITNTQN